MKHLTFLSLAFSLSFFSAFAAEEHTFNETGNEGGLAQFEAQIEAQAEAKAEESLLSLDDEYFEPSTIVQVESSDLFAESIAEEEDLIVALLPEESEIPGSLLVQAEPEFSPLMKQTLQTPTKELSAASQFNINIEQVFEGAPTIYTVLFLMSMATVFIWFYSLFRLNHAGALSEPLLKQLRQKLHSNQYDEALALCTTQNSFFCKMLAAGISARSHGLPVMIDSMKTEGKRATVTFWQRLAVLNDIALIAPMLGLLGTVLGMFYAFYDLNRSMESFSVLFDGLGISVGTTVAGLIVAILALILNSIAKYRLVRVLVRVENEAQSFASLIDNKTTYAP